MICPETYHTLVNKNNFSRRPLLSGSQYEDLFNLTFTYRADSTVPSPSGRIKPKSKAAVLAFEKGQWLTYNDQNISQR